MTTATQGSGWQPSGDPDQLHRPAQRDGRREAGPRTVPAGHAGRRRRGREDPAGDSHAPRRFAERSRTAPGSWTCRRCRTRTCWSSTVARALRLQSRSRGVGPGGPGPPSRRPRTARSSWTTVSRSGTPAPCSSTRSFVRVPRSGCWPPAGRRWRSPGSSSWPCSRWRRPAPTTRRRLRSLAEVRRGRALHRAGAGCRAGLSRQRREPPGRRRALPAAGRDPARPGAGRGTAAGPLAAADPRAARGALRRACGPAARSRPHGTAACTR